jgi:hypothetical protein
MIEREGKVKHQCFNTKHFHFVAVPTFEQLQRSKLLISRSSNPRTREKNQKRKLQAKPGSHATSILHTSDYSD